MAAVPWKLKDLLYVISKALTQILLGINPLCKTLLSLLGLLWSLLARVVLESLVSPRREAEQGEINSYHEFFMKM